MVEEQEEQEERVEIEGGDLESREVGEKGWGMSRKKTLMDGALEVMSLDWILEERNGIL